MTEPEIRKDAPAIDVNELHKYFGDNEVLKGIDFHVDNGQVVCVVGPSGSGKSTLLRCVNLLEQPTSGTIFVEGVEITDPDINVDRIRSRIGMVFQQFNLFPHLSVMRNLTISQQRVKKRQGGGRRGRPQEPGQGRPRGEGGRLSGTPVRRSDAAGGDRPCTVHGSRHDAVRRADQRARP
jgi:ABC-type sugar transport system ATPase subunit